jgi:deoxyribose-phosphate aldolase
LLPVGGGPGAGTVTGNRRSDVSIYTELGAANPDDVEPALLDALVADVERYEDTSVAQRCASLWSRSIKGSSQLDALELAIRCVDLTTLEGIDTPGRVDALCAKAVTVDPNDTTCPRPAAVCVYPDLAGVARGALDRAGASDVAVAAVATGFPSGRTSLDVKLAEIRAAVDAGATEIDIVIDRGALLAGDHHGVYREIRAAKDACGDAHLKTILETGELGTLDKVSVAAHLACWAGSDFVKTSTGKIGEGATPATAYVLTRTVVDHAQRTGRLVGVKAAGGIRSAKDAVRYLVMVDDVAGRSWLTPQRWRFGASTLLNDLVAQRAHLHGGRYLGADHFTIG